MKVFKVMMALAVAMLSAFTLASCDEDDVNNVVENVTTSGMFTVEFTIDPGTNDATTIASLFNEEFASVKSFNYASDKKINQAVAIEAFEAAVKGADSYAQAIVNKAQAQGLAGVSVKATLTNVTTNKVVKEYTWTATATPAE
jgi:uncharacterized lipoprotein YehR (DUF1307 family)